MVSPTYETPTGMARAQFPAMGTTVTLLLPTGAAACGTEATQTLFASWERALSRFRPESELARLNVRAGAAVAVSPLLYDVVATALAAARATDGLYDPTLLRPIVALGYDRSFDRLPAHLPALASVVGSGGGWRHIVLDAAHRLITLPPGVGLDLGGIAKGLAVDAALARLAALGVADALVNAGGDLAVRGLPPEREAWPIAVPGRHQSWTIPLHHGAIATSGIARHRWQQGAMLRHHLLDPRTSQPSVSGLWSVTVAAGTCGQAEVAAKTAFLLGAADGADMLVTHGLAGVLVAADGMWRTAGGWPTMGDETGMGGGDAEDEGEGV
jgi:thiamine biosynthesis lipoprotein